MTALVRYASASVYPQSDAAYMLTVSISCDNEPFIVRIPSRYYRHSLGYHLPRRLRHKIRLRK